MNRADRLRKVAPGATDEAVSVLSALPADQVALIATFARQARRDALRDAADRKRRAKADDRNNANYDEDSYTRRNLAVIASHPDLSNSYHGTNLNLAVIASQGERARAGNLDALTGLGQVRSHVDAVIGRVVEGCRAEGLSDKVIGDALGVTKQAVQSRWPRQAPLSAGDQAG